MPPSERAAALQARAPPRQPTTPRARLLWRRAAVRILTQGHGHDAALCGEAGGPRCSRWRGRGAGGATVTVLTATSPSPSWPRCSEANKAATATAGDVSAASAGHCRCSALGRQRTVSGVATASMWLTINEERKAGTRGLTDRAQSRDGQLGLVNM